MDFHHVGGSATEGRNPGGHDDEVFGVGPLAIEEHFFDHGEEVVGGDDFGMIVPRTPQTNPSFRTMTSSSMMATIGQSGRYLASVLAAIPE